MDGWTIRRFSSGNKAFQRVDCKAGYFEAMPLVKPLLVILRIINDGHSRSDIDKVSLTIGMHIIIREKFLAYLLKNIFNLHYSYQLSLKFGWH